MRTKTLLLSAAATVLGAWSVSAQVYSVNAVGYVNATLVPKLNLVANPLNAGTGNNVLSKVLVGVPDNTAVFKFNGTGYDAANYLEALGGWDTDLALAPGEGAFVQIPGTADVKVTFVGEVMQGTLSNPLPAGLSIKSSMVPQSGGLSAVLGFPAADQDTVFMWDKTAQGYVAYNYLDALGGWDTEPTPAVGEAFWVKKSAASTWTRTFSVNN